MSSFAPLFEVIDEAGFTKGGLIHYVVRLSAGNAEKLAPFLPYYDHMYFESRPICGDTWQHGEYPQVPRRVMSGPHCDMCDAFIEDLRRASASLLQLG